MMAESLQEKSRKVKEGQNGQRDRGRPTDPPQRTKSEIFNGRQGLLFSLRTAVKRTRTTSQSDHLHRRRHPEIIIVSPEHLPGIRCHTHHFVDLTHNLDWPSGTQLISQGSPSYDLVIQRKHNTKPIAAPRRITCSTIAIQTEPVRDDISLCRTSAPQTAGGRKPLKPLRLSKGAQRRLISTCHSAGASSPQHTRSVNVFWELSGSQYPVSSVPTDSTPSSSENSQQPTPRPRTKLLTQSIKLKTPEKVAADIRKPVSLGLSRATCKNDFLKEVGKDCRCDKETGCVDLLDQKLQEGNGIVVMADHLRSKSIRDRIQAFESHVDTERGKGSTSTGELAPHKPPVATKPLLPIRMPSMDNNQNIQATSKPTPAPKPLLTSKPMRISVREQLEQLHKNGSIHTKPPSPELTGANSTHRKELPPYSLPLPVKPPKEPLKPNLNINNRKSAMSTQNEHWDNPPNDLPFNSQQNGNYTEDFSPKRHSVKRPTTIRVPSKTSILENSEDNQPPLPIQLPIGSVSTPLNRDQTLKSNWQPFGPDKDLTLPPRKPSLNKAPPVRPPSAKSGPGRPPPPNFGGKQQAQTTSWQPPPKPQAKKHSSAAIKLPPRPKPGHRLYNKYTLELPHGIACLYFNGSPGELSFKKNDVLLLLEEVNQNEYWCQTGDATGRVRKSHIKVITPLENSWSSNYAAAPEASAIQSCGLKVQALYDFIPEDAGDLALRAGDVVTDVEQVDSQWYKGSCRGAQGFFPVNFVQIMANSSKTEKESKPPSSKVSGPRCLARFDFEGEQSDELSFSEGDVIQLKEYVDNEWGRGQIENIVGIFPLNFVEIIEDLPQAQSQQALSNSVLPGVAATSSNLPAETSQSSTQWGVALFDYTAQVSTDLSFKQGDQISIVQLLDDEWGLGKLSGREGTFPRTFVEFTLEKHPLGSQKSEAVNGMKAKALYDFASDCDEELSFQMGDILTNLESIDGEWFLAELRGRRALVPKNYVYVLH